MKIKVCLLSTCLYLPTIIRMSVIYFYTSKMLNDRRRNDYTFEYLTYKLK